MSYDLYFYRRKNSKLEENRIREYLNTNLFSIEQDGTQWFVENEDTETYFFINKNERETDEESIEIFESFSDYENTHYSFNLNFLRPDFFGQFAFEFVDKFINDLDLYVLNPQSHVGEDSPIKPESGELYRNWSVLNAGHSATLFEKCGLIYYPLDKSDYFFEYNLNRESLQEKLGDDYYVPRLYLLKRISDGVVVTLSTWTQHIPNVFPLADYYLLNKKYKKIFRNIEEDGIISSSTLYERFGSLFSDFEFKDCKIIHPQNAEKAKDLYNSTQLEYQLKGFLEKAPIDKVVNRKADESQIL